ncbi:MAG: GNAT family N-acetyltransferase [Thermoflexales bacterium]
MADETQAVAPDRALSLVRALSQRAGRQLDRLDHWPLEQWVGAPGLRFAGNDDAGWAGVLVVPVDTGGPLAWRTRAGGPAWIRWIAVDAAPLGPRLRVLLRAASQVARDGGVDSLWLLCDSACWLDPYLRDEGYRAADEVITLERSPARPRQPVTAGAVDPIAPAVERTRFRGVSAADGDTLAVVDARAFGDPWRYAPAMLARELSMASVARVALDGDRLVGYATAVVRESGGHINRIAVDPDAQGRGVGNALLADINGQLIQLGSTRITLNTQRSNVISQRMYRSSGFRVLDPPLRVYHRPLA